MKKELERIVKKYKLLPGFLQEKAFYSFFYEPVKKIDEGEALKFAKEMFKATKSKQRMQFFNHYYVKGEFGFKLVNSLSIDEQKDFLMSVDEERLFNDLFKIDSTEVKEEVFPRVIEYINNSSRPNWDISMLRYRISAARDTSFLLKHIDDIFKLAMQYDEEKYYDELAENKRRANEDKEERRPQKTVLELTQKVFSHFSQEQKNVLGPKILDEILRYRHDPNARRPTYETPESSVALLNEAVEITRQLPTKIQEEYYKRLMEGPRNRTEIYVSDSSVGDMWFAFNEEVQSKHFDEELEFLSGLDFSEHFSDYKRDAAKYFWQTTNEKIQRAKAPKLFSKEALKRDKWMFLDLYETTNGKLQSEILDRYMKDSFSTDPQNITSIFREMLERTSQDVFDRNFQYFFAKVKDKPSYVYWFLHYVSDEVKVKYSRAIGKFFSVNLESLIISNVEWLVGAACYLDSESYEILFDNIFKIYSEGKELKNEKGEVVYIPLEYFFRNMGSDKQIKVIDTVIEDERKRKKFTDLFKLINDVDIDIQKEWIQKYYSVMGCNEKDIALALKKYTYLLSKNNSLNDTVEFDFLISDLAKQLTNEQLLRITHYPFAQKKILLYKDNNAIIKCFEYLMKQPQNWTITADAVFSKLDSEEYKELLENIKSEDLSENDCRNLLAVLQSENGFGLSTYDDIKSFDLPNGKRMQHIYKILNGDFTDLPPALKNKGLTESDIKRKAVLELITGGADVDHLLKNYYEGISEIKEIEGNSSFNKELKELKKFLEACNFVKNASLMEINGIVANILAKPDEVVKYSALDIESRIINLYGESIDADLYRPEEHKEDLIDVIEYDDNGVIKNVSIYKVQGCFNSIVRVEGAYSSYFTPENYKEYFDNPSIEVHGNCESIIGNDLIAPAKNTKDAITVAYSSVEDNSLLLSAPYDLYSSFSNRQLAPIRNQSNCCFYGVKGIKDRTRHTHNEIVRERVIIDKDGNVDKLKPEYLIWFQEELDEKIPVDGDDGYTKWKNTQKAAAQLGVPIVIINREYYAIKEMEEMSNLEKIVLGEAELPKEKVLSDLMSELLIKMENNSNSLRFSEKIKKKYFNVADRDRINSIIQAKIESLIQENPKEAAKCIEAVQKRYEFEQKESEYDEIKSFYEIKLKELTDMSEDLVKFYSKERKIETDLNKMPDYQAFRDAVSTIAYTDYYKNQKQHSIEHIEKVMLFSKILAYNEGLSEDDTKLLVAAAAFHDSSRNGEDGNSEHAKEGAVTAKEYFMRNKQNEFGVNKIITGVNSIGMGEIEIDNNEVAIIQTAIDYHEHEEKPKGTLDMGYLKEISMEYGVKESDFSRAVKIAGLLKDADALDRTRFAKKGGLNPAYLRSNSAKSDEMIDFAKKVNDEYAKVMLERNYGVTAANGENVGLLRECRVQQKKDETQLSVYEMLELFSKISPAPKIGTKELSYEEKLRFLFMDYGEAGITVDDVEQAEQMIQDDLLLVQQKARENKQIPGNQVLDGKTEDDKTTGKELV